MAKRGPRKISSWGPVKSPLQRRFYRKVYRKYPELRGRHTEQDWYKIRDDFFQTVADIMIEQDNGVVLDGLGYFSFPAYSKKSKLPFTNITNFVNRGLLYYTQFFGYIFNRTFLKGLSFELLRKHKDRWQEKCREGVNYKCHHINIKNIVGNGQKRLHPTRKLYR
jgi:hypothetical protein